MNRAWFVVILLTASAALAGPARPAPGVGVTAGAGPAKTATLGELMADQERLLYFLAQNEWEGLLEHAFKRFNISPEAQGAYKMTSSIRLLADDKAVLSPQRRRELVSNIVSGVDRFVATQADPRKLMELAAMLVINGVMRDLNTLEYWGKEQNERVQGQLRPVAEAVSRIYGKAAQQALAAANALVNKISDPSDPRLADVDKLTELEALAKYNKAFNDYAVALSMDAAAAIDLGKTVDSAVEVLKEFDNPEAGVQAAVRTRIGKLLMAKGEFEPARAKLDEVIKGADVAKEWGIIYEARYFRVVCDLLDKKVDEATKGMGDLADWQAKHIPSANEAAVKGAEAAMRMLEYRIAKAQFAKGKDPKDNERAIAVLLKLLQERPDLRSVIYVQLIGQLPSDPDVRKLDPLLLRAMIANGEQESRKKPEEMDRKVIQQALAATREILSRKDVALAKTDVDAAAFLLGLFYDLTDQDYLGAQAYLDYVQKHALNRQLVDYAVQNAEALIAQLRKNPATSQLPTTANITERFLTMVVKPPFNRKEFAFELAARLMRKTDGDLRGLKRPIPEPRRTELAARVDETVGLFRAVPATDARKFAARYYEMMSLVQKLELVARDINDPGRAALVEQIQKLAEETDRLYEQAASSAADDKTRASFRTYHIRSALTAASLAMTEKRSAANSPERAIKLLETFEDDVKGMPGEDELIGEAAYVRFQALMAQKKEQEALANLETYLERLSGERRIGVVQGLVQQFMDELDKAQAEGNKDRAVQLMGYCARLSGQLVKLVEASTNPEIRKYLDQYQMFSIRTKRRAAMLTDDPQEKKKLIDECAKFYETKRDEYARRNNPDDPQLLGAELTLALLYYDLGEYVKAQVKLAPLVRDGKTGRPLISVQDKVTGETTEVENKQYWESMAKLMRCNVEIAKIPNAVKDPKALVDETKSKVSEFYTLWLKPGGEAWFDEFEKLRVELLGAEWKPKTLAEMTSGTQPATRP